ncbi:PIG-L family deacetylase [bacterium]|nr:PIG-L family deacetylase [bacterium]
MKRMSINKVFTWFILFLLLMIIYKQLKSGELVTVLFWTVLLFYTGIAIAVTGLWFYNRFRHYTWLEANGENILIIAPHSDDCVAIAGGYAIETVQCGGEVNILYTTGGHEDDPGYRLDEALAAWKVINVDESQIVFLPFRKGQDFLHPQEILECSRLIEKEIIKTSPQIIFIPLYEGGNYQHDVTNYCAAKAIERCSFAGRVYESPEYNFYFSLRSTPEKIMAMLLRFVPGLGFNYAPEPVLNDSVHMLQMSEENLETKISMIRQFKSQSPEMLVKRFGFVDRYQEFHDYNYTLPPFDYDHTFVRFADDMKSIPVIGTIVKKIFRWTRTIHPDLDVRMTKICVNELEL